MKRAGEPSSTTLRSGMVSAVTHRCECRAMTLGALSQSWSTGPRTLILNLIYNLVNDYLIKYISVLISNC